MRNMILHTRARITHTHRKPEQCAGFVSIHLVIYLQILHVKSCMAEIFKLYQDVDIDMTVVVQLPWRVSHTYTTVRGTCSFASITHHLQRSAVDSWRTLASVSTWKSQPLSIFFILFFYGKKYRPLRNSQEL